MTGIILGAVVAAVLIWAIWAYNRFILLRNRVREAWSGIDVQLKRRYDLVPKLAQSVRGYSDYEQNVLKEVTELRAGKADQASTRERAADESRLTGQIRNMILLAENYPELKASQVYLDLQKGLVEVEDNIQYARRYFNGSVRDWNNYVESFPSMIIARMLGYQTKDYFEIELATEREAPKVSL